MTMADAFAYTTEPAVDRTAASPRLLGFGPADNPCTAIDSAGGDCHGLCLLQDVGHDVVRFGAISISAEAISSCSPLPAPIRSWS
jgi:hypothetical protein